jgi:hypothetical protein
LHNEDKFENKGERKGRKEAAKGLSDRVEKETREKMEASKQRETDSKQREKEQDERSEKISMCRAQKTMDDAIANGQERANKKQGTKRRNQKPKELHK